MKTRIYLFGTATLLVLVGALLWWLSTMRKSAPVAASTLAAPSEKARLADASSPPPKPTKFFQFNHQPASPEEKAIWDWWFYMDKHDPQFQWRTPLSFYGRVIDQHARPVAVARVWLAWNDINGSHEKNMVSNEDGRFELANEMGKALSVQVGKDGYEGYNSSTQGFEYSAFWEQTYYVASKDTAVLFRLWKLEDAEPMYFWDKLKKMTVDGQKVWFDTKSGRFGPTGDLAFSTKRGTTYAPHQFDWSLTVEAAPGGGLVLNGDELMFEAPESGYKPSWTHELNGMQPSYTVDKSIRFYLKTSDGRYAAVKADITQMGVPEAEVNVQAYVNPSGSRNLQYDAKKRLDPK